MSACVNIFYEHRTLRWLLRKRASHLPLPILLLIAYIPYLPRHPPLSRYSFPGCYCASSWQMSFSACWPIGRRGQEAPVPVCCPRSFSPISLLVTYLMTSLYDLPPSIIESALRMASIYRPFIPIRSYTIPISSSIYRSVNDINPIQPYLINPHRSFHYERDIDDDIMHLGFYEPTLRQSIKYVCHLVGRIRYRRQGCTYEYLYYDIRHYIQNHNLIPCLDTSCIKLRLHRPCSNCDGAIALSVVSLYIGDQEYLAYKGWSHL